VLTRQQSALKDATVHTCERYGQVKIHNDKDIMCLNYENIAEDYKPDLIKILLIGEAPPSNGKKYFYKVPEKCSFSKKIEDDRSLPATIFNHYFNKRPQDSDEYKKYLDCLRNNGVFLIDMINEPLKIRDDKEKGGINKDNLDKIFSDMNLYLLKTRISGLINDKTQIIFLVPRNYKKVLKNKLSELLGIALDRNNYFPWKHFRLKTNECFDC